MKNTYNKTNIKKFKQIRKGNKKIYIKNTFLQQYFIFSKYTMVKVCSTYH